MNRTHDDARERAEELRMEACLTELGGHGPDPALVRRILDGAQRRHGEQALARPNWRTQRLAAAMLLIGIAVVAAVAWLRSEDVDLAIAAPPLEPSREIEQWGASDPESPGPGEQDPKGQDPKDQDPKNQDPQPAPVEKQLYTLVADYSDNRIVELDAAGNVVFVITDVFGAWDVEPLPNGDLLITEFSVSRVREIDRNGRTVWSYTRLKNAYDADRLPNGNTLIANTFAGEVIEVDREGEVVWRYGTGIRPFDSDRLADGNTLIADVLEDRVIEVDPNGEIVWQQADLPNVHDADRLPNGNTLVTLRNAGKVLEIDRAGNIVWELKGLSSASDADRLPNGNTLVAENTRVREFDRDGKEVWKKEMTWAVEANRHRR